MFTGQRLRQLATVRPRPQESSGTELLAERLRIWGVRPDDPLARAVKSQLARMRLSVEDQLWLLETAERIAEAERAKAAWNPKAQIASYMTLCKVSTAAARLSREISELFPPPWTDERAHVGDLVAELAGFIEGIFTATMIVVNGVAGAVANMTVRAMKHQRSLGGRVHWELLGDLCWLASGRTNRRISERSVRRYLDDQRRPRSPVAAYWKRNFKLVREAIRRNPLQKAPSPHWAYDPSEGPPRPVSMPASRAQRKAIEAFTEIAAKYIGMSRPLNGTAPKAAKKRSLRKNPAGTQRARR
jgi:hypothetical protein